MLKPKINPQRLEDDFNQMVLIGPVRELSKRTKELSAAISFDHDLIVRHYCVALAKIALAIIRKAPDTVWLTDTETVVEYVCAELGIEHDNMEQSLEEFINFEPRAKELWEKAKEDQNSGPKSEKPDQLELCLQSRE